MISNNALSSELTIFVISVNYWILLFYLSTTYYPLCHFDGDYSTFQLKKLLVRVNSILFLYYAFYIMRDTA